MPASGSRNFFGFHDKVDQLMEAAIENMREQGAFIIDPANIETVGDINRYEFDILLYEFKADLNRYLSGLAPAIKNRSLKDLIAFNDAARDREMTWFGQDIFLKA
jgi:amidase